MKRITILLFLLVTTVAFGVVSQAYRRWPLQTTTGFTTPFQFSVGQNADATQYQVQNGFMPSNYTITLTTTGSPTTCIYRVKGAMRLDSESPSTADFSGGDLVSDIDCTAAKTTVHVANKPWNSLIGQLVTLSGGTSPTVQLEILAK